MPEVRYLKVFKGIPKYNNPEELTSIEGISTIKAKEFPHTEKGLVVVALIKIEPKFSGEWRIRIPDTSKDYWETTIPNPKSEPVWITFKYGPVDVFFSEHGDYTVDLSLNGIPFHKTILRLQQSS